VSRNTVASELGSSYRMVGAKSRSARCTKRDDRPARRLADTRRPAERRAVGSRNRGDGGGSRLARGDLPTQRHRGDLMANDFSGEGAAATECGRAGGGWGLLRTGGTRGVRGAQLRCQQPRWSERRRSSRAEVVLHESRRLHGTRPGRDRRRDVWVFQPEGRGCRRSRRDGSSRAGRRPSKPASRRRGRDATARSRRALTPSIESPNCSAEPPTRRRGLPAACMGDCGRSVTPTDPNRGQNVHPLMGSCSGGVACRERYSR
jgi:hypothetical protein